MTTEKRLLRLLLLSLAMLPVACSNVPSDGRSIAEKFMQAYFAQDNVAAATELASGSAKFKLDKAWQRIKVSGLKEPDQDKPRVDITLVKTSPIDADTAGYTYRVVSSASGVQPITVKLRLTKAGKSWTVNEFEQNP